MLPRWLPVALWVLFVAGCCYPVREQTDLAVCDLARQPLDVEKAPAVDQTGSAVSAAGYQTLDDAETALAESQQPGDGRRADQRKRPAQTAAERLRYPPELPGYGAKPIDLPLPPNPKDPMYEQKSREWRQKVEVLYPPLPLLGPSARPELGPNGQPLALAELEQIAMSTSPLVRQAASDVQAARGAAIQAGAYPNPTFGYESDTAGTGSTAGFQGVFLDQTIKTGNKLKLAQAAATMDLLNAQLALRRAQTDLMAQVRGGYFAVLVAQENVKINEALTRFTDTSFQVQLELLRGGLAAPYEPMQLRVLSYQARAALVQARNAYTAAWQQLAATLGKPLMRPTQLAGRVDMPIPHFDRDTVLARVLSNHTDVRTTANGIQKARYNLRLAQVTPIPDVGLHLAVQEDYSVPPAQRIVHSVQVGVPLPVFDQNKGAIIQAQGALLRAIEEPHRVRDALTTTFADAFNRYETNRITLEYYRDHILPDQVRAYQQIRYRREVTFPPDVSFGDIVTAQQTLATSVMTYVTTLAAQWQAVVDVANQLQTNELFGTDAGQGAEGVTALTDLEHLLALPCCHPCSPLPEPALRATDGRQEPFMPPAKNGSDGAADAGYEVLPLPPPRETADKIP
ncbi:MAG TPA: TolC family protein [Gemmataceae bacterium]|jgi:cobalt-zinc-cadmium efflux system outer membrane protein|nr:TolC family protein [Gemmataceae bacterium]